MSAGLRLPLSCREAIVAHAEGTYPEECCGALLGRDAADGTREVARTLPFTNARGDERRRRYLVDPADLLAAEKSARQQGLDVVGIYHSHPDHPSRPSEFDREHALPYWSYVIVRCAKGNCETLQSWRLRDDRSQFDEEPVTDATHA